MIEIINTWDQLRAAGGGVAICRIARGDGRSMRTPCWQVLKIDKNGARVVVDKKAHWSDYGSKVFLIFNRADIKPKLAEAKAWVEVHLREKGPWVRNRMYDYVPKRINDAFPIRREEK